MNLFQKIQAYYAERQFRTEASRVERVRHTADLNSARSIGVLFTVSDEDAYHKIEGIVKVFQNSQKNVKVIGFVNQRFIPAFIIPKLSYDFITLKDLNWYKKPVSSFVKGFINEEFDILIDFSMEDLFPLQYISGLSRAKLKVGRYGSGHDKYYDVMIQADDLTGLEDYSDQITHYLTLLNSENHE